MTFAELEAKARREVEDVGVTIFTNQQEIVDAANESIQEVVTDIRKLRPDFMITTTSIAFTSSETTKALPTDLDSIQYIRDAAGNKVAITKIGYQDTPADNTKFFYYQDEDGAWQLSRRTGSEVTHEAITLTIYYKFLSADYTTGVTTSLGYLGRTGEQLVKVKTVLNLLSNRGRRNQRKEFQENRLTALLHEDMQKSDATGPEIVQFIEE